MFGEAGNWTTTKVLELKFLEGKECSEAKFNYWLAKWKAMQVLDEKVGFS